MEYRRNLRLIDSQDIVHKMISDFGLEFVKKFSAEITSHKPIDDREREAIKTFCELAPSLKAPFDEHSDSTHVTASAIIVGDRGVVLHLHKRLNMWLQPGGHIESGESIEDAAIREAKEETGLELRHFDATNLAESFRAPKFIHLDVHPGPRGHTHLDIRFLLWASSQDFAPAKGESQDVKWFSFDEALKISEDGARGAIRVARQITAQ